MMLNGVQMASGQFRPKPCGNKPEFWMITLNDKFQGAPSVLCLYDEICCIEMQNFWSIYLNCCCCFSCFQSKRIDPTNWTRDIKWPDWLVDRKSWLVLPSVPSIHRSLSTKRKNPTLDLDRAKVFKYIWRHHTSWLTRRHHHVAIIITTINSNTGDFNWLNSIGC